MLRGVTVDETKHLLIMVEPWISIKKLAYCITCNQLVGDCLNQALSLTEGFGRPEGLRAAGRIEDSEKCKIKDQSCDCECAAILHNSRSTRSDALTEKPPNIRADQ